MKFENNELKRVRAKCKEDCNFLLFASKYKGEHTL